MTEINNIPKHWQVKKLGEVCTTTSGGTPNRGNKKYYEGNIPWVKSGELNKGLIKDTEEKISEEAIKNSSAKIFPKGTLLIALYGATIGKLAFLGVDAATNQAVCGIYKNENIDSNYLYYYLFSKKPSLVKQGIGGAQPNISQGILKNLELPIPPLPEQQLIVSKIEELLSDLENGKQQLLLAKQQLKVYRQSLLKWAFEGKLTNKNVKDGEMPKGWKQITLGVVGKVQLGRQRSPKNISKDFPTKYIRAANITENGLALDDVLEMEFTPRELEQYRLLFGDLILSEASGSPKQVGKPAIWKNELENCCFQNTVIRLRPKDMAMSMFLLWLFKYYYQTGYFANISGGVGINHLSAGKFSNIEISLPSLEEQQLIVDELESKLTVCDKIEETISQSLLKAESLKQSILKKAFEGKLV